MWGLGLNCGRGNFTFYQGFDSFLKPFLDEDQAFPKVFNMAKRMYEVSLTKPLRIISEEISIGKGVYVQDLVKDSLAA
jgi:hypothetical protein